MFSKKKRICKIMLNYHDYNTLTTLEYLVNGSVDPLSAAQTTDRLIVAECHNAYDNVSSDGEQNEAITPGGLKLSARLAIDYLLFSGCRTDRGEP
jgi:hypothetical protein